MVLCAGARAKYVEERKQSLKVWASGEIVDFYRVQKEPVVSHSSERTESILRRLKVFRLFRFLRRSEQIGTCDNSRIRLQPMPRDTVKQWYQRCSLGADPTWKARFYCSLKPYENGSANYRLRREIFSRSGLTSDFNEKKGALGGLHIFIQILILTSKM